MANNKTKKVLLEPANDEELELIEAFIQDQKIKAFIVEDDKADVNDVFNDVVRFLIPLVR